MRKLKDRKQTKPAIASLALGRRFAQSGLLRRGRAQRHSASGSALEHQNGAAAPDPSGEVTPKPTPEKKPRRFKTEAEKIRELEQQIELLKVQLVDRERAKQTTSRPAWPAFDKAGRAIQTAMQAAQAAGDGELLGVLRGAWTGVGIFYEQKGVPHPEVDGRALRYLKREPKLPG